MRLNKTGKTIDPEHRATPKSYTDNGCAVSSSCFTCPLPDCDPHATFRIRDAKIRELFALGMPHATIGGIFGLSLRQIYKIVKTGKEAEIV